jgi:hypothetical protein
MSTAASTTPFFGRAYSLTVTPQAGPAAGQAITISSDTFEPNALRFTFDIQQFAWGTFWQAEIAIYNANGPIGSGDTPDVNLYQALIQEGDLVTVCAGYQADYPAPATPPAIWTGLVFYTIQDRLDVVDERLILHCILNRVLTTQNFINSTLPALSTQFAQAQFIAQKSSTPIGITGSQVQAAIASASPQRGAVSLPRGKSYFGAPHNYLAALADQNSLVHWFDEHNWNVDSLQVPLGELVATYGPVSVLGGPPARVGGVTLSLIGQPQQTQLGVDFRVLLDPTVQIKAPLPQVAVQLQYVRQAPIVYPVPAGQLVPTPLVNQYAVIGVRFTGDTRGNAWYSDITAVVQVQSAIQLLGQSLQADVGNN